MLEKGMKIGKVARLSGLTTQAIRYYEREGVLPQPARTHTAYRVYDPNVLGLLGFVKQARRLGLSLGEIKEILRMSKVGRAPCCKVREALAGKMEELDRTIAELSAFRKKLGRFLDTIAGVPDQSDTSRQVCELIQLAPSTLSSPTPQNARLRSNSRKKRAVGAEETLAGKQR